jgi:hypothetical protein
MNASPTVTPTEESGYIAPDDEELWGEDFWCETRRRVRRMPRPRRRWRRR